MKYDHSSLLCYLPDRFSFPDVNSSTISTFFPSYCRQNLMLHRAEPWLFPFSHASKHKSPSQDDSASLTPLAVMQIFPNCVCEHSQGALVRSEECELAEMSGGRVIDLSEGDGICLMSRLLSDAGKRG